jgi:hypothetical protein
MHLALHLLLAADNSRVDANALSGHTYSLNLRRPRRVRRDCLSCLMAAKPHRLAPSLLGSCCRQTLHCPDVYQSSLATVPVARSISLRPHFYYSHASVNAASIIAMTDPPPTTQPVTSPTLHTSQRPKTLDTDLEAHALSPTTSEAPPPYRRRDAWKPGFRNPPPFSVFFARNWTDILTQLLCLLCAFCIYTWVPPIMPRYFPLYAGVEQSDWGMRHSMPLQTEYINTWVSAVVSYFVPVVVMGAIGLWGTRNFADGNAGVRMSLPIPYTYTTRRYEAELTLSSKSDSATPSAP